MVLFRYVLFSFEQHLNLDGERDGETPSIEQYMLGLSRVESDVFILIEMQTKVKLREGGDTVCRRRRWYC